MTLRSPSRLESPPQPSCPRKEAAQVHPEGPLSLCWGGGSCGGLFGRATVYLCIALFSGPPSSWNDPQATPLFQPGHKRTPSEAERWLEEVAKAAKAQQHQQVPLAAPPPLSGFPLSYEAAPLPAGIFASPHMPPTFVPVGTAYVPALPFPALPSVPVVGITPSQMVTNAFCTATQAPVTNLGVKASPFPQALLDPPRLKANGTVWSSEQSPPGISAPHPEPPDPFEAQWAALESKAPTAASNPFSGDRQKTFEIEL